MSAQQQRLVSAVIPVHNRPLDLRRAIESVLSQGITDLEVLVIDDASSEPVSLPDVPNARVIRHDRNRGAAAARNTALDNAAGIYLAFLDSDDAWQPGKLAAQLAAMKNTPANTAGVFSPFAHAARPDEVFNRSLAPADWFDYFLMGCRVAPGSTLMMATEAARSIGPQDTSLGRYEDWDWLLRAARQFTFAPHVPGPGALLGASGRPQLQAVLQSLDRMHEKWLPSLSGRQANRFLAAISVERAAACHWHKRYAHLSRHLAAALWHDPQTVSENLAWRRSGRRTQRVNS